MIKAVKLQQQNNAHHEHNGHGGVLSELRGSSVFFGLAQKFNLCAGRQFRFFIEPFLQLLHLNICSIAFARIALHDIERAAGRGAQFYLGAVLPRA